MALKENATENDILIRCKDLVLGYETGVVLTGDGARLLPHARALCAEYARLSAEVGALPGRAHISAATRQFLRYLDRRNALEVPAGCTGFDNQARFVYNHYKISDFL